MSASPIGSWGARIGDMVEPSIDALRRTSGAVETPSWPSSWTSSRSSSDCQRGTFCAHEPAGAAARSVSGWITE